jgi:hypothetical protein
MPPAVVIVNQASGKGGLAVAGPFGDQDRLITEVAHRNPDHRGAQYAGSGLMPWLDDVAAVLQVWYRA